ncbi:MAG: Nif3-like dinuclear metal center hexameric protein [Planctomycetota bacterium]|nr:MAG: Nif3-like dinuclear metal center hexameric protein [Planctomycetota bacterium]
MRIVELLNELEVRIPPTLAESWDNVGLLLGDAERPVRRVMTCLTLTSDVAEEAIREQVDLVITHHPILFKAIQRLTTGSIEGRMLLAMAEARVAVYSPHTAFDSARAGINQGIATKLGLSAIAPLRVLPNGTDGSGRRGEWPSARSLRELIAVIAQQQHVTTTAFVGDLDLPVSRIAIACGAAAEFLPDAASARCEVLITGEARFHACLEARERGMALVLLGHYASERPAVEWLAADLQSRWRELTVWSSRVECDPIEFLPGSPLKNVG